MTERQKSRLQELLARQRAKAEMARRLQQVTIRAQRISEIRERLYDDICHSLQSAREAVTILPELETTPIASFVCSVVREGAQTGVAWQAAFERATVTRLVAALRENCTQRDVHRLVILIGDWLGAEQITVACVTSPAILFERIEALFSRHTTQIVDYPGQSGFEVHVQANGRGKSIECVLWGEYVHVAEAMR